MNNPINTQDSSQAHENQFILSYELLALLQWMVEHDTHKLKRMIDKALRSGLKGQIERSMMVMRQDKQTDQEAQYSVIEFFGLLEALITETLHEQAAERAAEKKLLPAIDHIDGSLCDDETIQQTVQNTAAQLEQQPSADPHDTLYKELLLQWKPSK